MLRRRAVLDVWFRGSTEEEARRAWYEVSIAWLELLEDVLLWRLALVGERSENAPEHRAFGTRPAAAAAPARDT